MAPIQKSKICPVAKRNFVATNASRQVDEWINKPDVHGIFLSGSTGSGKSFLAEAKAASLWNETWKGHETKIFGMLNCSNLDRLYSDLALFYASHELEKDSLSATSDWRIIQKLYDDMEKYFPSHFKVFILDDAEDTARLLEVINNICELISKSSTEQRSLQRDEGSSSTASAVVPNSRWKIFVTSQKSEKYPKMNQHIGEANFISVTGFDDNETLELFRPCDIDDNLVLRLREKLGPMPLALKLCMENLRFDESADSAEFVKTYLEDMEAEMMCISRHGMNEADSKHKNVLIAIKVSIDRMFSDFTHVAYLKEVLKILPFFNEHNIPRELLVACVETVCKDSQVANFIVETLTHHLIERSVCSSRKENHVFLYSLHQLVQRSLKLLINGDEKEELLKKALIALNRVMPTDGRKHKARLIGFYAKHGEDMDIAIKSMPFILQANAPFILLLHCNLLAHMGYCLLAQKNGLDSGVRRLREARDKYCELVLRPEQNYDSIATRLEDNVNRDREKAIKLYEQSKVLNMLTQCSSYKNYISELAQYHRLTKKDLKNMMNVCREKKLVNGHLCSQSLLSYKGKCQPTGNERVISSDKLAQVNLAELLASIYYVWAKTHRERDSQGRSVECMHQAEAAMEIYNRVHGDFEVYLLGSIITEREMLSMKIKHPLDINEMKQTVAQLKSLTTIGSSPGKRFAYKAGLIISDLSADPFHEMACMEYQITCQGQLYLLDNANGQVHYICGRNLLPKVGDLAKKQVHVESARSHCFRIYATFLSACEKHSDAVLYVIKAMHELHIHLQKLVAWTGTFPELENSQFKTLYSLICIYYERYRLAKRVGEKLLQDGEEAEYVQNIVANWRDMNGDNQPAGDSSSLMVLETINDDEIHYQLPQPR